MQKGLLINLASLLFADDLALFGTSEKDLQHNINMLNNQLSKRGMKINAKKTKTVLLVEKQKHTISNLEERN